MAKLNYKTFGHNAIYFLGACAVLMSMFGGVMQCHQSNLDRQADLEAYMKGMDIIQIVIDVDNRSDIDTWIRKEEAEKLVRLVNEKQGVVFFLHTKGNDGYGNKGYWIDTKHVNSVKIKD